MKRIVLRNEGQKPQFHSKKLFSTVLENSPTRAINVGEMRKRVKILELIETAEGDELLLEDALHAVLKQGIDEFPWSVSDHILLKVIDDVFEAKDVPPAQLKAVENAPKRAAE